VEYDERLDGVFLFFGIRTKKNSSNIGEEKKEGK
jgi:hypothetical protein